MAHTVLFYSHISGHMTRLNEERGWTHGLPGERCVCVCVSVLYEHMRKKVPDYENVVVVELCIYVSAELVYFNLVEMETISNFYLFIYKNCVLVLYYYI